MNQKKYWLRGGITTTILYIIYFLNTWTVFLDNLGFTCGDNSNVCLIEGLFYIFLIGLLIFMAGSFLGWLYGKYKNKNT